MKTILIVEDDKNLRRLYRSEFEAEGYRTLHADTGPKALKIVSESPPDLVILDIRLPEIDGLETMAQILRKHGRVPIILNTAYSCYQDNFLAWAADAYMIKSSDLGPLKEKVRELLGEAPKTAITSSGY